MIEICNELEQANLFDDLHRKGYWMCEVPNLHRFLFAEPPGVWYSYFVGKTIASENILIHRLHKLTYNYAVNGLVYLFQTRFKEDKTCFEYLAMRASSPPARCFLPYTDERLQELGKYEYKVSSQSGTEQVLSKG